MLRSAAERLLRSVVLRRRLPREYASRPILLSPSCGLRHLISPLRSTEAELLRLASELVRPGSTVFDIGANQGVFSFAAAQLAGSQGRVIAVEPDPWLAALIERSRLDGAHPAEAGISIVAEAVAGTEGLAEFVHSARSRAMSHLRGHGSAQAGPALAVQVVKTTTLDHLCDRFGAPSVVKIDVEGAELEVFRGGEAVLVRHRPILVCEVSAGNSIAATALLHRLGYRIYDGSVEASGRRPLDLAPWSTLALPR